ncbi:Stealth CR1 domain-containing protein [Ureibacillus chungkukjangi]|uniref:Stealth CR1 domain-containing protein n=1 Tax=Ureibacillus chungkukjangi TaxID=1202712 RepID=UPI00203B7DED|nr:Stealth CR1 domain-containing protein [Ureibacillus chungkukjangi]MCM3390680.1 Stealth CR1 domain-containing protein [Ureibacillus chungkukjangi]
MENIDIVISWVDGSDPEWLSQKKMYSDNSGNSNYDGEVRFREWDFLKYWFRGIEKFAPWVNKIHFITWGHLPEWLNTQNQKLNIVKHSDFIPNKYLPTFSSHVIEIHMHQIAGLSENFIYFNDDFYLIDSVEESTFFKNNLPCDEGIFNYIFHTDNHNNFSHNLLNMVGVINQNFNFQEQLRNKKEKFINPVYGDQLFINKFYEKFNLLPGFYTVHLPQAFKKSTFVEVWEKERELMEKVSSHKFRQITDVHQYLMRYWQLIKGDFEPTFYRKNGWSFFFPEKENDKITNFIINQERSIICINDSEDVDDFLGTRNRIAKAFEHILSEKSAFEI